jgi:hypothetical protein
VRAAAKPSLRAASCCRVEVMKGGQGWRLTGFFSTSATREAARVDGLYRTLGIVGVGERQFLQLLAAEMREVGGEISALGREVSLDGPIFLRLEASISSSRSQISRSATDCTRPAERAPGNFRHSTGDSVKPTR